MTYEEAETLALKAIHDGGRGMIGAGRNHLHQRVARAILDAARSEAQPSGYDGGKSLGERWSALAPAHRFGRFLTEDAVPLIAPGTLLRFYSSDPWFEPGPDLPRCGEIVAFTGKVSNAFPKVGPHLEVAALDGKVWPGGGWVFRLFQFVSDPPALNFTARLSDAKEDNMGLTSQPCADGAPPVLTEGEEFLEFKEALSDLRSLRAEHRDLNGGGPGWMTRWLNAWVTVDELFANEDEAAYDRQQEDAHG